MRRFATVVMTLAPLCVAQGSAVRSHSDAPIAAIIPYLPQEADANGDTMLIRLCRLALTMPPEQRGLMQQLIGLYLDSGANPLQENLYGCNAMFYINGMPDVMEQLNRHHRLPRELTLRVPFEESALLRYMRLRAAQAQYAEAPGSRDYMLRRYCKPFYDKADAMLQHYLSQDTLRKTPPGAMGDCLDFMRTAFPEKTYTYVNNMLFWEHGEHFLEEVPGALLRDLHRLNWPINPGKIRLALEKLNAMLPVTNEEMIDCYAARPMGQLLELLTNQEGNRALPDLRRYAGAYDPELAAAALRLQLRLAGITPPDAEGMTDETCPEPQRAIRAGLLVDAAIRHCDYQLLTPELLKTAEACYLAHGMPKRAAMLSDMYSSEGLAVSEGALPALATAYEELREKNPQVVLLRYLLEHPGLLQKQEARP